MRRWDYQSEFGFSSDDGYLLTYAMKVDNWLVYSPEGYLIAIFDNSKLLKEKAAIDGTVDYLLYNAERIITIYEDTVLKPFKKIRDTYSNEVTHAKALLNTEYGISSQIRRNTHAKEG